MKKTKILKIMLAMLMIIIQLLSLNNNVKAANIGETKDLERGELGYYCVQKWNGTRWIYLTYNQTFYTDNDGQRYIAYCLCPGLPGVGYVSGEKETYQVNINKLLDDDVIWRVLKNGYPNKSIDELGVETADDAYFATMQAINSILRGYSLEQARELYCVGQFSINGENYEDIQRRGNKTLNAMFNLIDIGLNGTETREQFLQISIIQETDFIKENDEYYSQTFSVQSASEISEYRIENVEKLPDGAIITDENGNKKQCFSGGEKFKVIIPVNQIINDISGKIHIKAIQKNYPIYYGASSIEGFQDYALCNNSYSEVNVESDIYVQTNKSKLIIIKVDRETHKPINGVKFKITSAEGNTEVYTTNNDGKIIIENQKPGLYIIKEIETNSKYNLLKDEMKVELRYNETKEITIENELKKGNIKVVKVDKDNNQIKLEGVKFQLKNEKGEVVKEGVTDKNGELVFSNLLVGKYELLEIRTKQGYDLMNDEVYVNVETDKTNEIKIENKKTKIPEKKEELEKIEIEELPVAEKTVKQLPKTELPKTGESKFPYAMVGTLIMIGVYNIIAIIRKIIKKQHDK